MNDFDRVASAVDTLLQCDGPWHAGTEAFGSVFSNAPGEPCVEGRAVRAKNVGPDVPLRQAGVTCVGTRACWTEEYSWHHQLEPDRPVSKLMPSWPEF